MKYGAVPNHLLSTIDLTLPPEPFSNTLVLTGVKASSPKIYIGAAVWGDTSWKGKVFPPKTPLNKFRHLYAQYFNSIELNATHYRIYDDATLREWSQPARGKDFRYCPKFPQEITHYGRLTDMNVKTDQFLSSIMGLGENLGPSFIQLPETFAPARRTELLSYLSSLPIDLTYFLELRHPDWFGTKSDIFNELEKRAIGALITDSPGRRDAVHMQLTIRKCFVRFVCNGLHPSSYERSTEWIEKIATWTENGLEECYVFLHPGSDAVVPDLASFWVKGLNKRLSLTIPDPLYLQNGLFG